MVLPMTIYNSAITTGLLASRASKGGGNVNLLFIGMTLLILAIILTWLFLLCDGYFTAKYNKKWNKIVKSLIKNGRVIDFKYDSYIKMEINGNVYKIFLGDEFNCRIRAELESINNIKATDIIRTSLLTSIRLSRFVKKFRAKRVNKYINNII